MQDLKYKVYLFLDKWMTENKIPQIRKGMQEELEQFILKEVGEAQINQIAEGMSARKMVQMMPPNDVQEASDAKDPE